jgi:hypothetical protein
MATLFSDHFNTSGTVGNGEGALAEELALDTQHKVSAGLGGARLRYKKAKITVGTVAGVGDEIRMLTMKSSDRIHSILLSSDGGSTAGDADLGWYNRGLAHDGAVASTNSVDALSTTAIATDTAADRSEMFENGDYSTEDLGKMLWELINVSDAATYAADPGGEFDLTFTVTVAFTVAVSTLQLEVFYTSGD